MSNINSDDVECRCNKQMHLCNEEGFEPKVCFFIMQLYWSKMLCQTFTRLCKADFKILFQRIATLLSLEHYWMWGLKNIKCFITNIQQGSKKLGEKKTDVKSLKKKTLKESNRSVTKNPFSYTFAILENHLTRVPRRIMCSVFREVAKV